MGCHPRSTCYLLQDLIWEAHSRQYCTCNDNKPTRRYQCRMLIHPSLCMVAFRNLHCSIKKVLHAPGPLRAHIRLLQTTLEGPNPSRNLLLSIFEAYVQFLLLLLAFALLLQLYILSNHRNSQCHC